MPGSTTGLLAAWASAYLQHQASVDDVIEHVLGHKSSALQQAAASAPAAPWHEPITAGQLIEPGEVGTLVDLLTALRKHKLARVHAAFPIEGDAAGVGPGPALGPAYAAGAAVLIEELGLVLVVTAEDEEQIEFTLFGSQARVQYVSVAEATLELTEAIHRSTSILTDLDVASWDPRLGSVPRRAIEEVGAGTLPSGCPPRATHLLVRAHQLRTILVAASEDPGGGSVSTHEAAARDAALAPLRRHVARALGAAYNSVPF